MQCECKFGVAIRGLTGTCNAYIRYENKTVMAYKSVYAQCFSSQDSTGLVHVLWDWTLSQCWWRVVIQLNWHFEYRITY